MTGNHKCTVDILYIPHLSPGSTFCKVLILLTFSLLQ